MDSFERFASALVNLRTASEINADDDLEPIVLTGAVGLFEFCFEQAWKAMKAVLEKEGNAEAQSGSPLTIIRLAFVRGLIGDDDGWLDMLRIHRLGVHAYNEAAARAIIAANPRSLELFEDLYAKLKARRQALGLWSEQHAGAGRSNAVALRKL